MAEIERRAAAYGLPPLVWPDPWPGNMLIAMRVATFAKQTGRTVSFALAAFRQAFAAGRDLSEPDNVLIAAAACELHPNALLKAVETERVKNAPARGDRRGRRAGRHRRPGAGRRRRGLLGGRPTRGGGRRGELRSAWMADLPDAATCYELLARMALIRRFEEEAGRQYQRAKAGGFLHLAIGEEATIVGTTSVMRDEDYLIGTYRTHGHAIARGTDPKRVMAELFGRVDGTSGGRGGSMHIFDAERRFMGGYGIVGGNLPIAAGLALSCRVQGRRRGHRLHVRRRRLQRRQLRRDDEPGGALEAAGPLPGREQPLRDGHLGRAPLGPDRPLEEGRGLRHPRRSGSTAWT